MLSVASELRFTKGGVFPGEDARSIAERTQDALRAPVVAGLHSLAAASLATERRTAMPSCAVTTLDCEGARARARGRSRHGPRARRGTARKRPCARGTDGCDRQPEQALSRACRRSGHRLDVTIAEGFTVFPITGIPELREGDDLAAIIAERVDLADLDIVVVAQKAISKIEGRVVRLDAVEPSRARARDRGQRRRSATGRVDPARGQAHRARARAARHLRDTSRLHLRVGRRRPVQHARSRDARAASGRSRRVGCGAARRSSASARDATSASS